VLPVAPLMSSPENSQASYRTGIQCALSQCPLIRSLDAKSSGVRLLGIFGECAFVIVSVLAQFFKHFVREDFERLRAERHCGVSNMSMKFEGDFIVT
jgi:hypothetical protein